MDLQPTNHFIVFTWLASPTYNTLKEQYPATAHVPNFDFLTGCREFKWCEESKRTLKNRWASRLAEFDTTLTLLRISDQWSIVPVKFRFGRNRTFLAFHLLPLARGPREGKHFNASWTMLKAYFSPSFQAHTTVKGIRRNGTARYMEVTEEILWNETSWSTIFCNDVSVNFSINLRTADKIKQTGTTWNEFNGFILQPLRYFIALTLHFIHIFWMFKA